MQTTICCRNIQLHLAAQTHTHLQNGQGWDCSSQPQSLTLRPACKGTPSAPVKDKELDPQPCVLWRVPEAPRAAGSNARRRAGDGGMSWSCWPCLAGSAAPAPAHLLSGGKNLQLLDGEVEPDWGGLPQDEPHRCHLVHVTQHLSGRGRGKLSLPGGPGWCYSGAAFGICSQNNPNPP